MKKSPSAVDHHIGAKIRARRIEIGLSQEKLGEALGITFQQIQKYEKGSNRMGAGRLQQAALALGVPIGHFYEGAPGLPNGHNGAFADNPQAVYAAPLSAEESALLSAFRRVGDPTVRKRVQQLVEAMGEE